MKEILIVFYIMIRWSYQWFVYHCKKIDNTVDKFFNYWDDQK